MLMTLTELLNENPAPSEAQVREVLTGNLCRCTGYQAIVEAARLRLRPILMTTLTTVAGMSPLAFGLGEGSEMLQPLAVCMVFGLLFSMLVSLLLIPSIYLLAHRRDARRGLIRSATPSAGVAGP